MPCRSAAPPRRRPGLAALLLLHVAHAHYSGRSLGGSPIHPREGRVEGAGKDGLTLMAYDWSKSTTDNHQVRCLLLGS